MINAEIKNRIEQVRHGEVPEGWQLRPLREIASLINSKAKEQKLETLSISAGIGFVNQAEKFGKEMSGAQYVNYTVLQKGDFSYNKGNSKKYPQGCIYMLEERETAAVPNVFNSFRMDSAICDSGYYVNLFISGYLNRQLCRYINSGVRNDGLLNLYDEDFYSCEVPVPPIAEQQKIAEILAQCDKVILLKQELLDEKRKQKKWLMQNLLNPDSSFRLPGFMGKWRKTCLDEICTVVGGGTPDTRNADYWTGNIPWISSSDIKEHDIHTVNVSRYITEEAIANSATQVCPKDTILIVSRVGVGKVAVAPFELCTSQDFANLVRIQENIYFTTMLLAHAIEQKLKYLQGTSIKGITVKEIKALKLQFPSIAEQTAIANILATADKEIDLLEQELSAWKEKKKCLAQLLLTGLVRV